MGQIIKVIKNIHELKLYNNINIIINLQRLENYLLM